VALGIFYRWALAVFFVGFTYVELIDKVNYLNHYYLVSLLAFLMIFMPLDRGFSLRRRMTKTVLPSTLPFWCLLALRVQVGLVYFFAGVAKLKPDWLFEAQPLRIWLQANTDLPLIGPWLGLDWLAYAASWAAMAFDLTVAFFLCVLRTR